MTKENIESNSINLVKRFKKCSICGKQGEPIKEDNFLDRYYLCSKECEDKCYIEKRECGQCRKELIYDRRIEIAKTSIECSGDKLFCSDKCKQEYLEEKKQRAILSQIQSILPAKFVALNTDKKEILKKSLEKSLFIWGDVGTGKTVFIASLVKEYIKKGIPVKWYSFPSLIMELQKAFSTNKIDSYTGEKINAYYIAEKVALTRNILFLDDLGTEKLTDFVRQIMYYIINEREQRQLLTVITSNFSLSKIDEQIDSRISSRIAGMCEILKFTGKDRRMI